MREYFIKAFILALPILLFVFLLCNHFAPSGVKTLVYTMGDVSPFVQKLLPDDRVDSTIAGESKIIDDPVYFSVFAPPGNFSAVSMKIAFSVGTSSLLEIGGLKDVASQAFDFQPLANTMLENLPWTSVSEPLEDSTDNLVVYAKNGDVDSVQGFLSNPPDRSQVATYRADFPTPYRMKNYVPLGHTQTFSVSLRGPQEMLTYVKHESVSFSFVYSDINRTYGADAGFARILNEDGEVMAETTFADDGNNTSNQISSENHTVTLADGGWAEGVYRIELSGTSDIIWRSITTSQRYLVIKNNLYLGDEVGFAAEPTPVTFYTDAKRVTFVTAHAEGEQTIRLGTETMNIQAAGEKSALSVSTPGILQGYSPVGDIKITGSGKFSFTRDSFFEPDPVSIDAFTDLSRTDVRYVLAKLSPVKSEGDWRIATGAYNLADLAQENGAYKFAFSVPLALFPADNGGATIHSLELTFTKDPLTVSSFIRELKHFVKQILF